MKNNRGSINSPAHPEKSASNSTLKEELENGNEKIFRKGEGLPGIAERNRRRKMTKQRNSNPSMMYSGSWGSQTRFGNIFPEQSRNVETMGHR
jgi:hypothetical protein